MGAEIKLVSPVFLQQPSYTSCSVVYDANVTVSLALSETEILTFPPLELSHRV